MLHCVGLGVVSFVRYSWSVELRDVVKPL